MNCATDGISLLAIVLPETLTPNLLPLFHRENMSPLTPCFFVWILPFALFFKKKFFFLSPDCIISSFSYCILYGFVRHLKPVFSDTTLRSIKCLLLLCDVWTWVPGNNLVTSGFCPLPSGTRSESDESEPHLSTSLSCSSETRSRPARASSASDPPWQTSDHSSFSWSTCYLSLYKSHWDGPSFHNSPLCCPQLQSHPSPGPGTELDLPVPLHCLRRKE